MTRRSYDGGATLVELLVAVALTGLIAPALTTALVIGWQTTGDTVDRLSDSRNRKILPSLFTRDVQNARTVDTTSSDSTCVQPTDTLLVRMRWTETPSTGSAVTYVAAWVKTSGTANRIERRFCDSTSGSAPVSNATGAHGVLGVPSVTCRAADGSVGGCSTAVTVTLSVTDASGAFSATGRRRLA